MSKKNDFNSINEVEQQINKLKKKKNDILKQEQYRASQKYRKERARRLIETGALAEKYFDIEHLSLEDKEEIFEMFSTFVKSNMPKKYKKN